MARTDRSANALGVAASTASGILTAAGFWLSYANLHGVADQHGLHEAWARAWAWPATIDLFVAIGEILIVRAALAGRRDGWAIALTIFGSGCSVALNIAGAGTDAPFLNYVVDALPPIGALLSFGALMRQVHEYIATHAETQAAPAETAVSKPSIPLATAPPVSQPAASLVPVPAVSKPKPVTMPVSQPVSVPSQPTPTVSHDLLTSRELMAALGISRATLSRRLKDGSLTPVIKDPTAGNLFHPPHTP